ncbi:hypothetical protein [Paenibacillus sp. HW567]|uniref:hypothetical protein n=1 Tax=Paenibacillus sp. HW567 TaxID=1034769 RepID=UPI0003819590|nr:hypothetical protein [Paenibacillus sp. HW567]
MNAEHNQEKFNFSEDKEYFNFHFSGNHGEIIASLPKSEEQKAYEKKMALLKEIKDSKFPPLDTDLAYVIAMCDVNYEGIRLTEEEKQQLQQLLKGMVKDRLPIQ